MLTPGLNGPVLRVTLRWLAAICIVATSCVTVAQAQQGKPTAGDLTPDNYHYFYKDPRPERLIRIISSGRRSAANLTP